jgi:hypothetical protein
MSAGPEQFNIKNSEILFLTQRQQAGRRIQT